MIIIHTYDEDGIRYLDYGINAKTGRIVILPPEPIDLTRMPHIHYNHEEGYYYTYDD